MKVSIIIPNYNGAKLLKNNFESVIESVEYYKRSQRMLVEIIVIDDSSVDNSLEVLSQIEKDCKKLDIPFKLVINAKNLGFSSTVNKGVGEAKGEIIILLNTDVQPKKDFIDPLVKHFSDEKVFSVGALDESIENGKNVERGRGIGRWERGFLLHRKGEVDKSNTLWTSGGSSAFKREYWMKLGGFYSLYNPFYWEDIDLSYRAQKAGYKVIFEKKSIVVHKHSEGSIKSNYTEELVRQISYRNQFYFVWINITDKKYMVSHIIWLVVHLFVSVLSPNRAFLYGFFSAFKNIVRVLQLRIETSRLFIKSDKDVLSEFGS